jgi:hypothetical protein
MPERETTTARLSGEEPLTGETRWFASEQHSSARDILRMRLSSSVFAGTCDIANAGRARHFAQRKFSTTISSLPA